MSPTSWAGWSKKISGVRTATLCLVLTFTAFYGAGAETTTPQNPSSPAEQFGPQLNPCITVKVSGDTWLDRIHALVQDKTCEPAVWFDNFFGRDHVLLDLRPGTFIKLRNAARLTEGFNVSYVGDFYLTLDLPKLDRFLRKARLYVESGSEIDKFTAQPGQPLQPGINRTTGVRQPVVGVRVDPYIKPQSLVSLDSGIKINRQPDAFIRMRYQYSKAFGEMYLIRFSEIVMWQAVEHLSNTSQLDFERIITTFTLVRWGNSVTYIDDTPGVTWNTGISFVTQLTPMSAISFDTSMWGVNDPVWTIQNYRVGSLYRLNFYRPWLFFEIAPEVTWPEDESGQRNPAYALMSTLEIRFGR